MSDPKKNQKPPKIPPVRMILILTLLHQTLNMCKMATNQISIRKVQLYTKREKNDVT